MTAHALLTCLSLLALLATATSQSTDGPLVTSVSGCTDTGSTTVDCVLPVYLTVRGSGFLINITTGGPLFSSSPSFWITPRLELSPAAAASGATYPHGWAEYGSPANDTYFVFQLAYLGRGVLVEGEPLRLTVVVGWMDRSPGVASPPFEAVTIKTVPAPAISSISGCPVVGADGQSVAQCLPDVNVLTLTGSGFLQWYHTPLTVNIGSFEASLSLTPAGAYGPSKIVNDTAITVSLDSIFPYLLAAHDFGAPPLSFHIGERLSSWRSVPMSIQFAALPPPAFYSSRPYVKYNLPLLSGCAYGLNKTIVNCTAGYSGIQVSGLYLYDAVGSIGGQPMTAMVGTQQDVKVVTLATPIYNFQPGLLYDFVLTTASGSITVPDYISFAGTPTIVSAACRDPLLPIDNAWSIGCQVGETVTLNGPYLPPPTTTFTVTIYSPSLQQNVSCANARYNSEYQLACDVLEAGPAYEVYNTWYLEWANGLSIVIPNRYGAWDEPTAPRIRHITSSGGCGNVVMSGNVTLSGCRGGETLQLYGTNFLSGPFDMLLVPSTADTLSIYQSFTPKVPCDEFVVLSDTYATCVLPQVVDNDLLQYDTPYMMVMWNRTEEIRSNALFLTFASIDAAIAPTPAASSSPSLALLVALPVALGLLAVVVVAATVRQLRGKARSTRRGPSAEFTDVDGEQREAEQQQAERGNGGWWQSRQTLASQGEVRGVELIEA